MKEADSGERKAVNVIIQAELKVCSAFKGQPQRTKASAYFVLADGETAKLNIFMLKGG